jgi:group I intron endonuclease
MDFSVYKITNIINDRVYFGSTKDFKARKKQHLEDLFNKKHHNYKLQRDFDKFGAKSFKFEVVQYFNNQKDMLIHEYQLINSIDNVYNVQKKDYTLEGKDKLDKNQRVYVQKTGGVIVVLKKERKKKTSNKDSGKGLKKVLRVLGGNGAKKWQRRYKINGELKPMKLTVSEAIEVVRKKELDDIRRDRANRKFRNKKYNNPQ